MGAAQSTSTNPQHEYSQKIALFSSVFSKMLREADIIDFKALTSGPGACGSYVLLLKDNIAKEFKTLKLATKNDVKEFVFAKRDTIETATDSEACENLAIFYIRALQFVAAIMVSVYNPPEVLPLLRNKTRKDAKQKFKLVVQKILTPQQLAQMEQNRKRWFEQKYLQSTQIPNIFNIDGDEQLSFDKLNEYIIYNDFTNSKQYKATLFLEELDTYNIKETDKVGKKYWITLKNPINGNIISRRLINDNDSSALIYTNSPPNITEPESYLINTFPNDWTTDLTKELIKLTPGPIPVGLFNPSFATSVKKVRHNYIIQNSTNIKVLPINFKSSYDLISKWFSEKDAVLDVNPATYRSVLLYNTHVALGENDSTNMAADFWQNTPITKSLAFSSLESLYNDNDTGFMSTSNEKELNQVTTQIYNIYYPYINNQTTTPKILSDVMFPDFTNMQNQPFWANTYKERILDVADAEGKTKDPCPSGLNPNKSCWPPGFNMLLSQKLSEIQNLQNEHLENCLTLLKDVFVVDKNNNVYFTEKFLSDVRGVREILEDYIEYARKMISAHYIEVETKYYEVVQAAMN